jgi:hypothetical protein
MLGLWAHTFLLCVVSHCSLLMGDEFATCASAAHLPNAARAVSCWRRLEQVGRRLPLVDRQPAFSDGFLSLLALRIRVA